MTSLIPVSKLVQRYKTALQEWLTAELDIPWNYLDANLPPRLEARGGIKVSRIFSTSNFERFIMNDQIKKNTVVFQLRIILSSNISEEECESDLLDWEELLENAMIKLSLNGINLNATIPKALLGISLSEKGHTFITEEIQSQQGLGDRLYKGSLYSEYIYQFERTHNISFS